MASCRPPQSWQPPLTTRASTSEQGGLRELPEVLLVHATQDIGVDRREVIFDGAVAGAIEPFDHNAQRFDFRIELIQQLTHEQLRVVCLVEVPEDYEQSSPEIAPLVGRLEAADQGPEVVRLDPASSSARMKISRSRSRWTCLLYTSPSPRD